jgi:hypothetical protein
VTQVGGQTQTQRVRQRSHEGFLRHANFRWAQVAVLLSLAATGAYIWFDRKARVAGLEPPNGGSWLGYLLGVVSAGLIVWLACLGLRKRMVTDNYYLLKAWVSAHVYLGLSLIVLATLHTGFKFGWNVHTVAYGLMLLVIASGGFGVWAYSTLPRRLHTNRGELTRKKMIEDIESLDAQLATAAQPLDRDAATVVRRSIENTQLGGGFWERVTNTHAGCPNAQAIRRLQPLLAKAKGSQADILRDVDRLLRQKADALTVARRQMQITALLEAWLFVHVPATFALLAALTAHIVSVFIYW